MPLYAYRATDEEGRPVEGRMEAATAAEAVAHIQDRRLRVSSVDDATPQPVPTSGTPLSWADIDMLNRQILSVLKSGMPLSASLREVAKEIPSRPLRTILEDVHDALEKGASIDEAFERHAGKLPATYLSMIRAGERSGDLPGVLQLLTQQSNRALDLRGKILQAAAYPLIVLFACFATVIFQSIFIVPIFAEIFTDFDARLPWATRVLIDFSDRIRQDSIGLTITLVVVIGLGILIVQLIKRSPKFGSLWDRLKLNLPVAGRLYRIEMMARFSRALTLMMRSGVPLVESVDLASAASGNQGLRSAGMGAATQIAQGTPLSDALESTRYFSHTFNWLLGNAEQRGDILETLDGISEMYEREATNRGNTLGVLVGPILVIFVGIVVGSIFVALYSPIFSLADSLSG